MLILGPLLIPLLTAVLTAMLTRHTRAQAGVSLLGAVALVLTAIVIGFALLCFALVLGAFIARRSGQQSVDRLDAAEPVATEPLKPPVLEERC